jgi:ADP-dependent NAD(P)H-hydrate dehydratase / NAD(P)H-hydrate epimerase
MTELLTSEQMRAIEQAAIKSGSVTGLELMERAGQGVVEAIFEHWPAYETAPQSVTVLCGPGNNGGDGFVVARLLQGKGWTVRVLLYGDPEKLPPDARTNYDIWCAQAKVETLSERTLRDLPSTLYIDALFGTGLTRPLQGELFSVVRHLSGIDGDDFSHNLVAIDAPSGLCLDSGRVLVSDPYFGLSQPAGVKNSGSRGMTPFGDRFATLTVAFDAPKVGHFVGQGPTACGKLVIKDIGLKNWRCFEKIAADRPAFIETENGPTGALRPVLQRLVSEAPLMSDCREFLRRAPSKFLAKHKSGMHKFTHGHALVCTGGSGHTGAARLAARGALRIGAGLVTLGVPPAAQMEVANQITALMLQRIGGADQLADVLADQRINALCLGPGLGLDRARKLVPVALSANRPCVLDADGLSAFAESPETLFQMLHERCVLTPHGGEFARLFPDIAERLHASPTRGPAYSKVTAVQEAAERAGCTVLFKGADTVIAGPNGLCSVHSAHYDRVAPWLATAGSGDVLAGFITGLLARGVAPQQACETAAWVHVECALRFGPGLIAEDLPEQIPAVLKNLEG